MKETYSSFVPTRYARQILQMFRQRSQCEYSFKDETTKQLKVFYFDGRSHTIRGNTWNEIAYELNLIMNTPAFRLTDTFLRYKKKQRL